jgi:succinyl-CoA synthetase beta subunit
MTTLSEAESKRLLAGHGIPVPAEAEARTAGEAAAAAADIGFPVVAKLCGAGIAHKTERGLVRLGLADEAVVTAAAAELLAAARPEDGDVTVLVGAMVPGVRELIAGAARDPQFGPVVMLGVGGVLAEALADVAFRLAPLSPVDAEDLIDDLGAQKLLGPFRGEPGVDRASLVQVLVALGDVVVADASIRSVDLNPVIVSDGQPGAVDALVEVED